MQLRFEKAFCGNIRYEVLSPESAVDEYKDDSNPRFRLFKKIRCQVTARTLSTAESFLSRQTLGNEINIALLEASEPFNNHFRH